MAPFILDPDSGPYASIPPTVADLQTFNRATTVAAGGQLRGMLAGPMLFHYLSRKGTPVHLSSDELFDGNQDWDDMIDADIVQLITIAGQHPEATTFFLDPASFQGDARAPEGPYRFSEGDLHKAMGGFFLGAEAKRAHQCDDGSELFAVTWHVRDRYNFHHNGLEVLYGFLEDSEMARLHETGYARSYDVFFTPYLQIYKVHPDGSYQSW